jgi:REP element-mobilizing transposase RayT
MRTPRSILLEPHVSFHKMWQCHDFDHLLADQLTKRDYLDQLFRFKPRAAKAGVRLYAFCLMDNHVHECGAIAEDFRPFSDWMRVAHGTFGRRFNQRHGRRGKVAIERPKTVVLEDDQAILQVMLYLDANPVAAGLVEDAAHWPWSSHRRFAFGEINAWTRNLDVPEAYLSLGDTPEERQARYRALYEAYVFERLGIGEGPASRPRMLPRPVEWIPVDPSEGDFFGKPEWVKAGRERLAAWRRDRRARRIRGRPDDGHSELAA